MRAILLVLAILAVFTEANAQALNEHCIVAVLNRTAQVHADGSWDLPNVPANFGTVRARATCVEGGQTLPGQSEPFFIQSNRMNAIPQIVLGPTTPIPNQITLTASTTTLSQAGQTVQLTVTGQYADGSSQDIGNSATGTQFLVSNPQLATVSANGLVTALQSGTVLIQAINEGAQGLLSVSIALSSDTDGDGILDDIELREGLNPNNPADALDDADRDGLTNKDELQRGTDLHKADSDGDGLLDGEEVKLGTNPLLKDTDGDGVPDNIEVATGSDPLNSLSFNLAKALKGISVSPVAFTVNVNTVDLVAYQQLQVAGEFTLGGTINLTAKAKGTSYASSNLQVCNFGTENGRVYGGSNGSCTITVSNSGFTATAIGLVKTFTPQALSYVSIPGFANNVEVSGNYAYIASGSTGLQVVDVSNKAMPKIVASLDTPGNGNDVEIVGNYAYLADDAFGLRIIDISNPLVPALTGVYDTPGIAWDVAVRGGYAFVADGASGLQIIDVSNPAQPSRVGFLILPGTAKGVDVDMGRRLAVVAAGTKGVYVVNIRDTATPILLGTASGGDVRDVAVNENYAFLADYSRSFTSVDISNPAAPVVGVSTPLDLGGRLQDIALSGNFVLGADVSFINEVPLIDISNPATPQTRAILSFSGFRDDDGTGIAADASYLYLTAAKVFSENGVIGDTRLYIGQYRAIEDRAGVAPTVSVISPVEGDTVIQGARLAISAQAADDVAVAAVIFNVNGTDIFTDTTAPYEASYAVPSDAVNLTLSADAVDFDGNQAVSSAVNVTAIPDPLTTAIGNVVDQNGTAIANAEVTCLGIKANSNASGQFIIFGLPTIQGDILCTAEYSGSEKFLYGFSNSILPVRGANTDVGTIYMSPISNSGRDFWIASQFIHNVVSGLEIIVLSETEANFAISSTGYSYTGSVSPQTSARIPIPNSLRITSNQLIESKGIYITSDADISVFLKFLGGNYRSDMVLAVPTKVLGMEYFTVGYSGRTGTPSEFLLVATKDNTSIKFSPNCQSLGGTPAGSGVNLILNAGQIYQYQCLGTGDMTGTRITSDKPIGVIAGAVNAIVPANGNYINMLFEMMLPVETLYGKEFFSAPFPDGVSRFWDVFRIVAASDGTTVTVDQGNVQNTYQLAAGQFKELSIESGTHFTSNLPISVTQYSIYLPSQMQLIPTSIHKNSYRFHTGTGNANDFYSVIIIAPNTAVPSVRLNGALVTSLNGFQALPGGTHQYAVEWLLLGQSVVTSEQPISVYVYTKSYSYSNSYPAGF